MSAFLRRLTFLANASLKKTIIAPKPSTLVGQCRGVSGETAAFSLSPKTKLVLITVGCFTTTAVGNTLYENWKAEKNRKTLIQSQIYFDPEKREIIEQKGSCIPEEAVPVEKIRSIPVSRQVFGPTIFPGVKFTLFQYQTCPFCCKVRSFLDYYGIPYDVIEVNPVLRQQLKFSKYKKVPILVLTKDPTVKDNRLIEKSIQLNDSTLVTSLLASYFTCNPGLQDNLHAIAEMYPEITFASIEEGKSVSSVVNKYFLMKGDHMSDTEYKAVINTLSEERKWREWADNVLVHTLSPNIYQTLPEAIDTFQVFSNVGEWKTLFPTWERLLAIYVGAIAMYFVGKRLKKRHHLKGDVRESLLDAVNTWTKALKGKKFMGGDKPNLADLAVYGVLHSIEGTQAFSEVFILTKVKKWYMNVKEACAMKRGHGQIESLMLSSRVK